MKKILWLLNIIVGTCLVLSYLSTIISAETMPMLALFGITYPFWLLVNILFLVFWVISKKQKRRFILSALILLLGWNLHPTYYNFGMSSQNPDGKPIKIMTYNVRSFDRYQVLEGKETRNKIFDLIDDQKADIMCFQEFYYTSQQNEFNTRDSILEFSKARFIHEKYTHHMTGGRHFGVVTISKYPIIKKGEIPFDNDDNNFCIYSDCSIEGDTVRVFNAHLASIRFNKEDYAFFDPEKDEEKDVSKNILRISSMIMSASKKRVSQTEKVLEEIKNSPYPVVLCGDFNDPPISFSYQCFENVLKDAFSQKGKGMQSTYIGKFPSFRIDYIFHSEDYVCASYETIQKELSDHKAVVVELKKNY